MHVIGVLNAKGGVGKTMLTTILAVRACDDLKMVAIVDLDSQLGSIRWHELRGGGDSPAAMIGESVASDAAEKLDLMGYELVIFDGAPGALELTEEAIQACDFVLIPLKASDQDTHSTSCAVSACIDNDTPYMMVVNDATPGKNGDKRAIEIRDGLRKAGQPVAEQIIYRRVSFVDATNHGKSAAELKGKAAADAKAEIDALYAEVMAGVKAATPKRGSEKTTGGSHEHRRI
jgi:chromosome partitioning protein